MNNWICSCKIQRRVTIISMSDDYMLLDERQEDIQRSLPEVISVIQIYSSHRGGQNRPHVDVDIPQR